MRTIQLTPDNLMPGADALERQFLTDRHYDRLVREDTCVLKPDGTVLLIYVRDAIPRLLCHLAFDVFEGLPANSHHRTVAAGGLPTSTGIAGYFDREGYFGFCRQTAFTQDHAEEFRRARRFIEEVSDRYRQYAPVQWERQREFIAGVPPDFYIRGTVFTTITVNATWRTAAHRDDGDFRSGLGVMTAMQRGKYDGGELIFPRFRTAVDMRTGGLCLADVHELHGNAEILRRTSDAMRLSFIFYAREGMRECGSADEEMERARSLSG